MLEQWNVAFQRKLIEPENLATKIAQIKKAGQTIVTLNGSFDLMHAGHLHMIYEASQMADVLIIALNSDTSIQNYKSKDRPIIPLTYRLQMMAAIGFVDYVTWFDETNPCRILSEIQPNVHVNGAEYGTNCIEAEIVIEHGGTIHIVGLVPGLSTTQIIKKINSLKTNSMDCSSPNKGK